MQYKIQHSKDGYRYALDDKGDVVASNDPFYDDKPFLPEPDGQEDLLEECRKYMNSLVFNRKDSAISPEAVALAKKLNVSKGKGTYSEDEMIAFTEWYHPYRKEQLIKAIGKPEWIEVQGKPVSYWFGVWKSLKSEPIGVEIALETEWMEPTIRTQKVNGKDSVIVKRWIYE